MTDPTTWTEYWSQVAAIHEELASIAREAKGATREEQDTFRQRHQEAGARLKALVRIAESGRLKHV